MDEKDKERALPILNPEHDHFSYPAERALALERLALLTELKEELQKHFRAMIAGVGIIGLIGIQIVGWFVIDQSLGQKIKDAEFESRQMQAETKRAKELHDKSQAILEKLSAQLLALESEAKTVETRLNEVRATATAESENVRAAMQLALAGVQHQVDAVVSDLTKVGRVSNVPVGQGSIEAKAEAKSLKATFAENSKLTIDVHSIANKEGNPSALVMKLREHGFKVTAYPPGYAGVAGPTILFRQSAQEFLPRVIDIARQSTGIADFNTIQFPYKGIDGQADFYVLPEGSRL